MKSVETENTTGPMRDKLSIELTAGETVTANLYTSSARNLPLTVILGHGAGTGQNHSFMVTFAEGLAARGVDVATFNFLYAEQGRRTPDRNEKLESCFRAVIAAVRTHPNFGSNRLVIGGKSMGGRIASQVAASGVEDLAGLVFLGYPLHPPGKPDQLRSKYLPKIIAPMLFVQGSRDSFGTPAELAPIVKNLTRASIFEVEHGDHSFGVPKKHPISQQQVHDSVMDVIRRWLQTILA